MLIFRRFGNVAIWGAPAWSEVAVQMVHGWPRKLSQHVPHRGIVPGNVIAASRATNMALRRFATLDVAANVRRSLVSGAGLTEARLHSCR